MTCSSGDGGNDYLVGEQRIDTVDGGAGNDHRSGGRQRHVHRRKRFGHSRLLVLGRRCHRRPDQRRQHLRRHDLGIENLVGTASGDILNGQRGCQQAERRQWQRLVDRAAGGNDIIDGGNGDDNLKGGDGVDYLYGGAGVDRAFTGGQVSTSS